MQIEKQYVAGLYLRLSSDDETNGESISIGTQRHILVDFCQQNGYEVYDCYIDDGYSGMNFSRPDFLRLLSDIDQGKINMVITKDLSRLGRDYIMTGYYSEVYFPSKGVRYIAVADDFDSAKGNNEIAPFKNILNEMYARDISKKVRQAKRQRAKQGLYVGSLSPYGYRKDPNNRNRLIVDSEAAEVVRLIFSLAESGLGSTAIASELRARRIMVPSAYKYQHGATQFGEYDSVKKGQLYDWRTSTVSYILRDPVYLGHLESLKTEVVDCKSKKYVAVPLEHRIVIKNTHEAIISEELFNLVSELRSKRVCKANTRRYNLFRGKLFCECCGHPLAITTKPLKSGPADMYFCSHHYHKPDECPKTHRVYHDMLYPYVLQQIRVFAKTMKRRKINSSIKDYANIQELTPEVLYDAIERIEIGHVSRKSRPGNVIQIYWKLK